MNDFNREQAFINIYSMNNIIRSLNDEELMYEYEELTNLFGRIVKAAVKDGYEMWTFIGQKIEKKGE